MRRTDHALPAPDSSGARYTIRTVLLARPAGLPYTPRLELRAGPLIGHARPLAPDLAPARTGEHANAQAQDQVIGQEALQADRKRQGPGRTWPEAPQPHGPHAKGQALQPRQPGADAHG